MTQNPAVPSAPNQPSNVVTDATMRRAYESLGLKPQSVSAPIMPGAPGPSQPGQFSCCMFFYFIMSARGCCITKMNPMYVMMAGVCVKSFKLAR